MKRKCKKGIKEGFIAKPPIKVHPRSRQAIRGPNHRPLSTRYLPHHHDEGDSGGGWLSTSAGVCYMHSARPRPSRHPSPAFDHGDAEEGRRLLRCLTARVEGSCSPIGRCFTSLGECCSRSTAKRVGGQQGWTAFDTVAKLARAGIAKDSRCGDVGTVTPHADWAITPEHSPTWATMETSAARTITCTIGTAPARSNNGNNEEERSGKRYSATVEKDGSVRTEKKHGREDGTDMEECQETEAEGRVKESARGQDRHIPGRKVAAGQEDGEGEKKGCKKDKPRMAAKAGSEGDTTERRDEFEDGRKGQGLTERGWAVSTTIGQAYPGERAVRGEEGKGGRGERVELRCSSVGGKGFELR